MMATLIAFIPIDNAGNKLYLKDLRKINGNNFAKVKTSLKDSEWEDYLLLPSGDNMAIISPDGKTLGEFHKDWLKVIK